MHGERKATQHEVAMALSMNESEVSAYISDWEPMADKTGHWVYFRTTTPKKILSRLEVSGSLRLDTNLISALWGATPKLA